MATNPANNDLRHIFDNLTKEYNAQETTEENVPFNNPQLYQQLSRLPSNACFAPLTAHDIQSSENFAPLSSTNTWEIAFNEQWQTHDRRNTFSKWCEKYHKASDYEDTMQQFDEHLHNWHDTLALNDDHTNKSSIEWFRPPTFPSTLRMSLEMELTSEWSSFYKDDLQQMKQSKYGITFKINQLYSTHHRNLIDAIYFAKCVNWNAAYDPKHSAKINIPIYWIFAEILFSFPSAKEVNGASKMYAPNKHAVPIACYGLMNVEVNAIKDWYKLSPHCPECREVRGQLQINDAVEVFVFDKWENGTIIDCVIHNHNEVNSAQRNEPIVEYLQVQTTSDAIIRYNRYDDRLRPCLNNKNIAYDSKILLNRMNDGKYEEDEMNQRLLTPPAHVNIEENAPPEYNIAGGKTYDIESNIETEQLHEYKVERNENIIDLSVIENINQDLMNSFDFRNKETMQKYQNDLRETMETMKQLALRRTVVTDIFRPVHLVCPKLSYRVSLSDEEEVNMTVLSRNDEYDYIALKMIDTQDAELSEMTVFMTKQQLFEHCTTYFHFADMSGAANDTDFEYEYKRKQEAKQKKEIIHKVPPKIDILNDGNNHSMDQSLDAIHQYMRHKDSSISPKRRNVFNESIESSEDSKLDPRSHLTDDVLCSFLHDEPPDNHVNESKDEIQQPSFIVSSLSTENSWKNSDEQASFTNGPTIHLKPIDDDRPTADITVITPTEKKKSEDVRSDTSDFECVIPHVVTQGMDLEESEEVGTQMSEEEEEYIMNNTKARSSVVRVGVAPNDGKYEEQERRKLDFKFNDENVNDANVNDIGVNAYDEIDDEINELNDRNEEYDVHDMNDRASIERIYTLNPCLGNACTILCVIILSIIMLSIVKYYDFDLRTFHWNLKQQIEKILADFGLI